LPLVAAAQQKVHAGGAFSRAKFPAKFEVFRRPPHAIGPELPADEPGYTLKPKQQMRGPHGQM